MGRGQAGENQIGGGKVAQDFLGLFGLEFDFRLGGAVLAQVDLVLPMDFCHGPASNGIVEICTSQPWVAGGGNDLYVGFPDSNDGDIKGAASQVIDQVNVRLFFVAVQSVADGGSGGLRDELPRIKAGQEGGFLGGSLLLLLKIGGHGDHRIKDVSSQGPFRHLFHFHQNKGADLLRAEPIASQSDLHRNFLILSFFVVRAAKIIRNPKFLTDLRGKDLPHLPLDLNDGIVGIERQVVLGYLPHHHVPSLGIKADHRRCRGGPALLVGDNPGLFRIKVISGHGAVGGAQINADHPMQILLPFM